MSDNQVTEPSETATPRREFNIEEKFNYASRFGGTDFVVPLDVARGAVKQLQAERDQLRAEVEKHCAEWDALGMTVEECTALTAELAKAREERDGYMKIADRHLSEALQAGHSVATLTAALDKAREDSKRLDWLENNPQRIGWRITNGEPLFIFVRPGTGINRGTFRAAIDAAKGAE